MTSMSVINYGGLVAFASVRVRLAAISLTLTLTTFDCMCFRITSASSTCVTVLIYPTGSIVSLLFDELTQVLDHVMTFSDPVTIAGDFSIHPERKNEIHIL